MSSTDGSVGRSVILVDHLVAAAIPEPTAWGYDFRIVGADTGSFGAAFGAFAEADFETATPIAALLSDAGNERSAALAGGEAEAWGARRGGEAARLVAMFAAREANIAKNAAEPPRPYLFPVRAEAAAEDALCQLAAMSALHRCVLDRWIEVLMREKVALKIENEGLHETLGDFQNVFWRVENTRSLGYEIKLGDGIVSLGEESLNQMLPVPTRGLSDIEFHVAHPATTPFTLEITLIEVETGKVLQSWTRSRRQTGRGWNRLSLPVALMGPRLSGALRLTLRDGTAPLLSTSDPTTIERAGACFGDRSIGAALALRLWQALPGTLSTAPDADDHVRWTPLHRETLERLSFAPSLGEGLVRDFEVFAKEPSGFRLHPLTDQVLVVAAPVTMDADTFAARVRVSLPDHRSQPVECAAAFLPGSREVTIASIEATASFSGWRAIGGGEEVAVETRFESEAEGPGQLCFAVRLAHHAIGQDYSRTCWGTLELLRRRDGDGAGPALP